MQENTPEAVSPRVHIMTAVRSATLARYRRVLRHEVPDIFASANGGPIRNSGRMLQKPACFRVINLIEIVSFDIVYFSLTYIIPDRF